MVDGVCETVHIYSNGLHGKRFVDAAQMMKFSAMEYNINLYARIVLEWREWTA